MKFTVPAESRPFAGYTVKRGIHRGGFGEVYYGVSDAGKEVALKLLQSQMQIELRGVRQCLNLNHPNLVSLYDIRTDDDGDHWIIMEYVAGPTLAERLEQRPNGLATDEILSWLDGMAGGLAFLHDRGIVHRDLKPANVFRDGDRVMVGDVGLSKYITQSRRNEQTQSVGTVYYMAPEVAQGRYGHEVDVYALGIVLFEMLTGRLPFEGDTTGEILMKHMTEEPDLTPLPAPIRPVVAAALEKDPERRTRSTTELVAGFRAAIDGRRTPRETATKTASPTETRPHVPPRKPARPAPPNPGATRAGATVSAAATLTMDGHGVASEALRNSGERLRSWWHGSRAGWVQWCVIGLLAMMLFAPRTLFSASSRLLPIALVGGGIYWAIRTISRHRGFTPPTQRPVVAKTPPPRDRCATPLHRVFSESLLTPATSRSIPIRSRLGQLTGSMAYAAFATALVTVAVYVLTPVFRAVPNDAASVSPLAVGFFGLSTLLAAWALLTAGKVAEGRRIDWLPRRLAYLVIGGAVGAGVFQLQEALAVSTAIGFEQPSAMTEVVAGEALYEHGRPTLAGYTVFFAALFSLRRWWWHVDTFRRRRFRIWTVLATCALGFLLTEVFAFPVGWGVLYALGLSTVVQLSAVWIPPESRMAPTPPREVPRV